MVRQTVRKPPHCRPIRWSGGRGCRRRRLPSSAAAPFGLRSDPPPPGKLPLLPAAVVHLRRLRRHDQEGGLRLRLPSAPAAAVAAMACVSSSQCVQQGSLLCCWACMCANACTPCGRLCPALPCTALPCTALPCTAVPPPTHTPTLTLTSPSRIARHAAQAGAARKPVQRQRLHLHRLLPQL